MAKWTGYLYEFYTNKPIDFVFSEWKKMSAINYKYEYTAYQRVWHIILICKGKAAL